MKYPSKVSCRKRHPVFEVNEEFIPNKVGIGSFKESMKGEDIISVAQNAVVTHTLPRESFYIEEIFLLMKKPSFQCQLKNNAGHEMIVTMPEIIENNTVKVGIIPEECRLDVIKSVVYGGLLEFITSLSVVVCAAGGDASTLNIVALALANVFGGLLVLAHNLRTLKQEQNTEHYEQQLGKPGHFLLHATITIISYLVFGLMSPIVYGFSFYKSDNKYLKLATLAPVSLICITLLSIGKAYTQRPPKTYMQTVFSYISLGVMVAGPGYIAGQLANMLLKKFQVFDGGLTLIEAEVVKGRAWSSY
uniref:Uncharacterized protein n=2 Tax=Beta vulgaris TaxID=161934 RepID=K4Q0F9_BETVU|nr:hypothetical protein [Beta vulgaris]